MMGATLTAEAGAYFIAAECIRAIVPARPIALSVGSLGAVFFEGYVIPLFSLGPLPSPIVVCECDDDLVGIAGFERIEIEEQRAQTPPLDLARLVDEVRKHAWQASGPAKENAHVG
jgi:hypothetical protein